MSTRVLHNFYTGTTQEIDINPRGGLCEFDENNRCCLVSAYSFVPPDEVSRALLLAYEADSPGTSFRNIIAVLERVAARPVEAIEADM